MREIPPYYGLYFLTSRQFLIGENKRPLYILNNYIFLHMLSSIYVGQGFPERYELLSGSKWIASFKSQFWLKQSDLRWQMLLNGILFLCSDCLLCMTFSTGCIRHRGYLIILHDLVSVPFINKC